MSRSLSSVNIYVGLVLLFLGITLVDGRRIVEKPDLGPGIDLVQEAALVCPTKKVVTTAVHITLQPGDHGQPPHVHSGPLVGYVLEGEALFQPEDGPPQLIKAGHSFYENNGVIHLWGANASNSSICRIFAVVIGEPGKPIQTFLNNHPRKGYEESMKLARMLQTKTN